MLMGKAHYLYHYVYAYTLGPAFGGLLAGLFHIFHARAHEPHDKLKDFDSNQKENLLNY